jgi:serine/threonine protein kinase
MPDADRTVGLADEPAPADGTVPQDQHQVDVLAGHAAALQPIVIPGYEIERELGRGGMGVVYKARQAALNRTVALKMVLGAADSRAVIRFLAEAESVAAIDHPNVVRVFDYGEADGRPFMALEYVPGGSLKDALTTSGPLPPADAAALVEKIARGVAAAHDLGIVHRDLKPGNILLQGARGEGSGDRKDSSSLTPHPSPLAPLTPKVADFGLAKRQAGVELTGTHDMLGTPGYMSPEQANGQTKFVGPTTDVWALGVILYECLTGARPFEGDSVGAVLVEIIRADAPSVGDRRAGIPRDLELICRKCMSKEPGQRYPTAGEVAEDLRRFLAGEPIAARPPSLRSVVRSWAGQNFGSAGWAVPGGAAVGGAVGLFTMVELLGTKLYTAAAVYDRLPSEPRPRLAFSQIDRDLLNLFELAMYLLIPGLVLATAALVRPRNRSADVAAGLVTGLVAALGFFAVGLGWCTVYLKAVRPEADDLKLLAGPAEELTRRYPDLAPLPLDERRQVVADKAYYDAAIRVPVGVLLGVFLSFAIAVPMCTALLCLAAGLLRQHHRIRSVALLYFEVTFPAVIFAGYFYLVAQRRVLMGMGPQHPGAYAILLGLTGCAVWTALAKWPAPVRVAAQVSWFGFYVVTNSRTLYEF